MKSRKPSFFSFSLPDPRFWAPFFVGVFFLCFTWFFRKYNFSYDGIVYLLNMEMDGPQGLFHPNHFLYNAVGNFFYEGLRPMGLIGPEIKALFPIIFLNSLFVGLAMALFFSFLSGRYGIWRGLAGTALFGFSNALLMEASDPGCYGFVSIGAVLLVILIDRSSGLNPFWTGFFHGILVLFHKMMLLAMPAFLWRIGASKSAINSKINRNAFFGYLGGLFLGAGVPYLTVAYIFFRDSLIGMFDFVVGFGTQEAGKSFFRNKFWSFDIWENIQHLWEGFLYSLIAPFSKAPVLGWAVGGVIFLGVSLYAAKMVFAFWKGPRPPAWTAPLLLWIAALSALQFVFAPGVLRFRILLLPAAVVLALDALARFRFGRWMGGGLLIILSLLFMHNVKSTVFPHLHPSSNVGLTRALWLGENLRQSDFFFFEGGSHFSIPNVYRAYFSPHIPARSLKGYLYREEEKSMGGLGNILVQAENNGRRLVFEAGFFDADRQIFLEKTFGLISGSLSNWISPIILLEDLPSPPDYPLVRVTMDERLKFSPPADLP